MRDELLEYINGEVSLDPTIRIEGETDLLLTGLVDSVGVIEIVGWLEDTTDVEIDPTHVVLDNFQTVDRMLALARGHDGRGDRSHARRARQLPDGRSHACTRRAPVLRRTEMSTRVLTPSCIAAIVRDVGLDAMLDDLIERLGNAFAAHDPEVIETIMRDGFRYTKPDFGLIEWMPSMETGRRVAIKTVGYHPNNPVERGAPSVLSTTSIHDTNDGRLLAVCESTFLTAMRTGAASAIVTDVLAIENATALGMIGCGSQAITQIHAISRIRPIQTVTAFDADATVAATLAERLDRAGVPARVEVVDTAAEVIEGVDVLCCATSVEPGSDPVVPDIDHRPWLHINAVGADHPGKLELPGPLLRRAVVIPDLLEQCLEEGESQQIDRNELGPTMPELVRHRSRHEHWRGVLTVFDSTGWSLEDLVVAEMMLDHAERLDEGFEFDLQPTPRDPYDPYEFLGS